MTGNTVEELTVALSHAQHTLLSALATKNKRSTADEACCAITEYLIHRMNPAEPEYDPITDKIVAHLLEERERIERMEASA